NQLLMYLHGTTDARGFKHWKSVGRNVEKGSKAFYILGPFKRTIERENADGETERVTFIRGFIGIPVFRLEDTEGAELPPPPDYRPAERPGGAGRYAPFRRPYAG